MKNRNRQLLPYYQKAKELLNYDLETGIFTWAKDRNWNSKKGYVAGTVRNGYRHIKITINKKTYSLRAHRVAWFICYGYLPNTIDHINMSRDDNRICNLRDCSPSENCKNKNKQKNNSSGFKGVHFSNSKNKWIAQIGNKGGRIHLGQFDCPKEASKAYEAKAKELHGDYMRKKCGVCNSLCEAGKINKKACG